MIHPQINHINDVLPHIEGRKDFVVAHKDGYSVIDYVYAADDTFADPMRLECRGLKFAPSGEILARPLHKFRNIGETPELHPEKIDFNQPHIIMEKLDGSMIHTAIVNGEVVFMTRMGRTNVAMKAEKQHLKPKLIDACHAMLSAGSTPIFEWTAPDNRIVVQYDQSELTLLAIRENVSGRYFQPPMLWSFSRQADIPLVQYHASLHGKTSDFLAMARAIKGSEGFVVRFENGLWVKAKSDDYVLKHRAKDSATHEKNVLALVLSGGIDDLLPLLDKRDAERVRVYADQIHHGIQKSAAEIRKNLAANDNLSPADYARIAAPSDTIMRSIAFASRKGDDPETVIKARLSANTNSQTAVDKYRMLHGAVW